MFDFFRVWLIVVAVGMAIYGIATALFAGAPLFAGMNSAIDPAFWKTSPDDATRQFQAWIYAVMGAVMAGWGLTVTILVWQAFSSRQAWVWWSIAAGVGLWFVLDTGQSLRHGVYANAVINTAILLALGIPLIGTLGEFR
jgi:hypothetical protein